MSSLTIIFCQQEHYVNITSGGSGSSGGTIFDPSGVTIESGSCVTKSVFLPCDWTATAIPPTANITVNPSSGAANVLYQVEICASSNGQVCFQCADEEPICVNIQVSSGSTGSTNYLPQGTAYTTDAQAKTLSIPYVGCLRSISSAGFATATFQGQSILVSVTENPNETNRSVTLTVTWCDGTTQTITITQTRIYYDWRNIDPSLETICNECQCTTVGCDLTSSVTSDWSDCANNQMSRIVSSLTRICCEDDWTVASTSIETSACTPPIDYTREYFTVVVHKTNPNAHFVVGFSGSTTANTLSYSLDNGSTWAEIGTNMGTTPELPDGTRVWLKGNCTSLERKGIGQFIISTTTSASCDLEGNIMSLIYGDNFIGQTSLQGYDDCFYSLINWGANVVSAENLILPATVLTPYCYALMFDDQSSLTAAPQLPATTLASSCYYRMFKDCTRLRTAPQLLATTLVEHCYDDMFRGCTYLNNVTCLATDISASYCTDSWLSGVASSGTFTKAAGVTWPSGASGIPSGWGVVNVSS